MRKNRFIKASIIITLGLILTGCSTGISSVSIDTSLPIYSGKEHTLVATTDESFDSSYNSGDPVSSQGITVTFDGKALSSDQLFYTSSLTDPTNHYLYPGHSQLTTNSADPVTYSFYAGYADNQFIYLSNNIDISIVNLYSGTDNSWVSNLVVGIMVAVLVIFFGVMYKLKKDKEEGKR